ncbi:prepilin-type N-terminal cleavage/methylation domain-containing protein [bacterium]|nr:prepilin-type N-terminal cleavage/methylation domain-containing protein [bacterium]
MRIRSGFSLLECMLTLGLVALVLGIATNLLMQYSRLMKSSASKSAEISALQVAVTTIVRDARQAVAMISPPAVPDYPRTAELRFLRVADPDWGSPRAPWLPIPVPTTPVSPTWAPHDPSRLQEICYYKDDQGVLWRAYGPPNFRTTPLEQTLLAESVAGLAVVHSGREVRIQLSFQGLNAVRVVTGVVSLPVW